jgi:hypothetical protein
VLGWTEARRKARLADEATPWRAKESKLVLSDCPSLDSPSVLTLLLPQFWRGAFLAPLRDDLREVSGRFPWGDVGEINWGSGEGRVAIEDHCKHKYLASVEGRSCESFPPLL